MRFFRALPDGRASTTTPASGTFASTDRRRKRWCAVVSGPISSTSGTTSLPTRRVQFRKLTAQRTWRPMRVRDGCARAGAYFVSFQQTAKDFAELSKTKLTMPVLAIGGEKANGELLGQQMKSVASDATTVVLKDTGHWVLEERPKETTDALLKFL